MANVHTYETVSAKSAAKKLNEMLEGGLEPEVVAVLSQGDQLLVRHLIAAKKKSSPQVRMV
jgi:hypothetical protein